MIIVASMRCASALTLKADLCRDTREQLVPTSTGPGDRHAQAAPWLVPFDRSSHFFGRAKDLERLHRVLSQQTLKRRRPVGVTGMAGIGRDAPSGRVHAPAPR